MWTLLFSGVCSVSAFQGVIGRSVCFMPLRSVRVSREVMSLDDITAESTGVCLDDFCLTGFKCQRYISNEDRSSQMEFCIEVHLTDPISCVRRVHLDQNRDVRYVCILQGQDTEIGLPVSTHVSSIQRIDHPDISFPEWGENGPIHLALYPQTAGSGR